MTHPTINRGFTFIELLVYSGLFSLLFISTTQTWVAIARQNATFMRLAQNQEALLFAATSIDKKVTASLNYSLALATITDQTWHAISPPVVASESTSSISHLSVTISPRIASSSWQLDYYHAQN